MRLSARVLEADDRGRRFVGQWSEWSSTRIRTLKLLLTPTAIRIFFSDSTRFIRDEHMLQVPFPAFRTFFYGSKDGAVCLEFHQDELQ